MNISYKIKAAHVTLLRPKEAGRKNVQARMLESHLNGRIEWSWKAEEGRVLGWRGYCGRCGGGQGRWPEGHEKEWKSATDGW